MLKLFKMTLVVALCSGLLYAQQVGTPGSTTTFFDTNPVGGQLGQLEAGTFGDFPAGNSWIALGKPKLPTGPLPVYGLRVHDNGQSGIFSLVNNGSDRDLKIQWGPDATTDFRLEFINDLNGSVANRTVMTGTPTGRIGIGTTAPQYRLDVRVTDTQLSPYAIYGKNDKDGGIGIYGIGSETGIFGRSRLNTSSASVYGVQGESTRSTTQSNSANYGVLGTASGANVNYGVRGDVDPSGGLVEYAIYGDADNSRSALTAAGYFSGRVTVTGSFSSGSDRRLKKEIQDEVDAMDRILQLRPTTYQFKREGRLAEMNLATGLQHGFIAQELEAVFPEAVGEAAHVFAEAEGHMEYKTVNYMMLIPILTKGIQEQQAEIESLKEQVREIEELRQEIALLQGSSLGKSGLEAEKATLLFQNTPNPFAETTEIRYQLAVQTQQASLLIFDMNGRQLKTIPLKPGSEKVQLSGSEFEAGIYLYTLIADGKEVATKRMILTQ